MTKQYTGIVVNNLTEQIALMATFEEKGFKWATGDKPTEWNPYKAGMCFPYSIVTINEDKMLLYDEDADGGISTEEYLSRQEDDRDVTEEEGKDHKVVCPGDIYKAMRCGIDHDFALKRVTDRNPALLLLCFAVAKIIEREIFGEKGE